MINTIYFKYHPVTDRKWGVPQKVCYRVAFLCWMLRDGMVRYVKGFLHCIRGKDKAFWWKRCDMGVSIWSDRELRVIDKGGKRGRIWRLWFRGRRYPTGKLEFPIVKDTTPKITNPRLYDTAWKKVLDKSNEAQYQVPFWFVFYMVIKKITLIPRSSIVPPQFPC